jgi:type II secretory pathway pseudopilin PulG
MNAQRQERGYTLVEVLMIISIIALLLLIAMPAIQAAREASRRQNCVNNMRLIGLGLHTFHDQWKRFPGSAEVITSAPQEPVGGWSFLFKILPKMGYDKLYNSINPADIKGTTADPVTIYPLSNSTTGVGNAIATARDTRIGEFLCPSNPNPAFENPAAGASAVGTKHALTSYKAMASAFINGFMPVCQYTGTATVPAGEYPGFYQCDGALFPSNSGTRISDLFDGTSHTILCGETMDYACSAWISGTDVNMIAIPTGGAPQATKPATISPATVTKTDAGGTARSFFMLPGFNGNYFDASGNPDYITFYSLDYGPRGKNSVATSAANYPLNPMGGAPFNFSNCNRAGNAAIANIYGPSSGHPSVINCLYGDGGVRSVRKDVDANCLFFWVTRSNNDPSASESL